MREILEAMGFTMTYSDHSVYIYTKGDVKVIMPVYIDDITIASTSPEAVDSVVEELKKHFKLRDLGDTSYLLGVHITRDRSKRTISLSS